MPPHLTPLAEGREVTTFENLKQAIKQAGQSLTDDQCACLFANIANVCVIDDEMADGGLLRKAAGFLRLETADTNDLTEPIETCYHTAKVLRPDEDWSLFCAKRLRLCSSMWRACGRGFSGCSTCACLQTSQRAGASVWRENIFRGKWFSPTLDAP